MAFHTKSVTAPLAIVKVNGIAVGKMRDIQINEQFQRGKVTSMGQIHHDELPVTGWMGTISCGAYLIDFKRAMLPGSINRIASLEEFTNSLLLQEDGIELNIFLRIKAQQIPDDQFPDLDPSPNFIQRNIIGKLTDSPYVTVRGMFLNRESFTISEGQVSGRNAEFEYLEPILAKNP